jgi:hypothetical protein
MAKAKEPPLWAPMFSLPNVHVKFPIDVDGFALVAPDDFRIKAIKKQQPRLGSFPLSSPTPSGSSFLHHVLEREIRPPTPRSEATVRVVTTGDIAELTATTFVALCTCFAVVSNSWIQWRGNAAERVSVNPH